MSAILHFENDVQAFDEIPMELYVHNGTFHADDVMCAAMLSCIYKRLDVYRISDSQITDELLALDRQGRIIIADIGFGKYDHHQENVTLRDDGKPRASCGLLYQDIKNRLFEFEIYQDRFEKEFLRPIEDHDNGICRTTLSRAVSSFMPISGSPACVDKHFAEAVNFLKRIVTNEIENSKTLAEQNRRLNEESVFICNSHVAITPCNVGPVNPFAQDNHTEFIVHPSSRNAGAWNVCTVKRNNDSLIKAALPDSWKTNPPVGCTFVHKGLFISQFDTKEHAIQAVQALYFEGKYIA